MCFIWCSARRRNNNREEKEPEWYTGGPTSQTDVIELRGFDHEEDHGNIVVDGRKLHPRKDNKSSFSGQSAEKSQRGIFIIVHNCHRPFFLKYVQLYNVLKTFSMNSSVICFQKLLTSLNSIVQCCKLSFNVCFLTYFFLI